MDSSFSSEKPALTSHHGDSSTPQPSVNRMCFSALLCIMCKMPPFQSAWLVEAAAKHHCCASRHVNQLDLVAANLVSANFFRSGEQEAPLSPSPPAAGQINWFNTESRPSRAPNCWSISLRPLLALMRRDSLWGEGLALSLPPSVSLFFCACVWLCLSKRRV